MQAKGSHLPSTQGQNLGIRDGIGVERQLTANAGNHLLTNANIWSPDGQWIVYDVRSDSEGTFFDGEHIEMVNVETGEVRRLYTSKNGAKCGVATFDPFHPRVVFILGPEHPSSDWQYGPSHRQGVSVAVDHPDQAIYLDARDLTPPLTPGALRGGSHVHVWDSAGEWLSFTYNDALLDQFATESANNDIDQRNVGVSAPLGEVRVKKDHPRNHDGTLFSVLVTKTRAQPKPGSDEIARAFEESWVGTKGYVRADGSWQRHSLAFQGEVVTERGEKISEVFIVDLPEDLTVPSPDGPLEGTLSRRPLPPLGTEQRRLTYSENSAYPGIQGARHWLKSAPDGSQIGFLGRDDAGVVQIWTVSPEGSAPRQITRDCWSVASSFSWNPMGQLIAYVADNSVFVVDVVTGASTRLTVKSSDEHAPLALACVFSPDGRQIAYLRRLPFSNSPDAPQWNQIFTVAVPDLGRI
jgi:hypothetical protein